ncbi:MAG: hypothetical protein BMS9Abin06_0943 [Gammaproteobacteria bacterium]|nr:MAG: hypothetical protein BMS9Abin06_0943 [Gammaproteobacteria bacterium]
MPEQPVQVPLFLSHACAPGCVKILSTRAADNNLIFYPQKTQNYSDQ